MTLRANAPMCRDFELHQQSVSCRGLRRGYNAPAHFAVQLLASIAAFALARALCG